MNLLELTIQGGVLIAAILLLRALARKKASEHRHFGNAHLLFSCVIFSYDLKKWGFQRFQTYLI